MNDSLEALHWPLGAAAEILDLLDDGLRLLFVIVLHGEPEVV